VEPALHDESPEEEEEHTMKKLLMTLAALLVALATTACGDGARTPEPSPAARDQYEVTVRFNTSTTQDNITEVEALLRTYDADLQFVLMESFPPIGRAVLATDEPNFCESVEAELEATSYVDDVSCQPWEDRDLPDPDAPVSTDNDTAS
jgi:hypothetical protein